MCLRFDKSGTDNNKNSEMPLAFQGNEIVNDEDIKKVKAHQVKCMASLIEYLVPGTESVYAIGGARVPIVRYFDTNIPSSVDISIDNS